MTELWSETPPTEPGWYWVTHRTDKAGCDAMPHAYRDRGGVWWIDGAEHDASDLERLLFGPRVPLPIAAPVARWAAVPDDGDFGAAYTSEDSAAVGLGFERFGTTGKVYEGVFVPTKVARVCR